LKINLKYVFKDLDGEIIKDKGFDLTLLTIIRRALLDLPPGKNVPASEKVERYTIAMRANTNIDDFTAEEITLIKKCIGELYTPIIVGQAYEVIEHGTSG